MGKPVGRKQAKGQAASLSEFRKDDIYEADDVELPEDRQSNRFDRVDNYEYELPSDFEDEEIDEDMAFTEEDKALYGHLFDSGGEHSEEAGGSEEDLLDSEEDEGEEGNDEEDDELAMFGEDDELASDEEEGGTEDENGAAMESLQEDESDEERHRAMLAAISVGAGAGGPGKKARKHREVVVTEAYPESEYNLGSGGDLTLTDLIAGLGDGKAKLGSARKALERLEKKSAPVSAPLPGPIKQRQERKAGYEQTKKEVTKWMPLVKANREAPTLRFTSDKAAVPRTTTTAALAAKHVPETDMEAEVAALLERAGAHSAKAVAEAEEALAMKALSVEEARERQNRLAKMRALLFYHELKAKRMKKIKSKEYHRKLNRAEKRKAAAGGGEAGDEEQLQVMMEEAEFERAKERLTLKHKNTSRWARRALKRGTDLVDDGTKEAIAEQLRLGQELRRKIDRMKPGVDDSDESTSASEDEGPSGKEQGEGAAVPGFSGRQAGRGMTGKVKAAALELLDGNGALALGGGGEEEEAPAKGLFALPFMRRALERKKAAAQEEARQILKELEAEGGQEVEEEAPPAAAGLSGRMAFGGSAGGEAAQQAQREAQRRRQHAQAAALNSDSELNASEDEDTEAKAQRLMRQLGGGGGELEGEAATVGDEPGAGHPAMLNQVPTRDGSHNTADDTPAAAATDGLITIELPQRAKRKGERAAGAAAAASKLLAEASLQQEQEQGGWEREQAWGNEGVLPAQHKRLLAGTVDKAQRKAREASEGSGRESADVPVSIGTVILAGKQAPCDNDRAAGDEASIPQPEYVAARKFTGALGGYAFKKGPKGVGYYLDEKEGAKAARQQRKAQQQQQQQQNGARAVEANSEDEGNMKPVEKVTGAGMSQADIVRMAFAGDDVATQFIADKAEEVQGELPQVDEPGMLPGWGTWAGQQREPKWMVEAREKAKRQRASAQASRKDAKLQYVIISEKWDKKSSKYKTPNVPFPFDSRETYERAMRQPLGKEYNTDASFRNFTRPAVLKDAGVIIEPIRYSKHLAENEFKQQPKAGKRAAVTTISGGMPKRSKAAKK